MVRKFISLPLFILMTKYLILWLLHCLKYCHFVFSSWKWNKFYLTFQEMNPNKGYWIIKYFYHHHKAVFLGKKIWLQCRRYENNSGCYRLKWHPRGFYTFKSLFILNIEEVKKSPQLLRLYHMPRICENTAIFYSLWRRH